MGMSKSGSGHTASFLENRLPSETGFKFHTKSPLDGEPDGFSERTIEQPSRDFFNGGSYDHHQPATTPGAQLAVFSGNDADIPLVQLPPPSLISDAAPGVASTGSVTSAGGTASVTNAAASPFVINVTYDASVASAPAAFKTVVNAVVQYFESQFTDPITINISVGYGEAGGNALGGALGMSLTYLTNTTYSVLRSALAADAKTADDTSALNALSSADPTHTNSYWLATAEAKALGLATPSVPADGFIGFSNAANIFDFDNSNGVTANKYDFFGVVAHELSEAMGRFLLVGSPIGSGPGYDALDLMHYSAAGVRDLVGGTQGYASINGGTTKLYDFNTNPNGDFGDWAASAGSNSFLAFANSGVTLPVTTSDLKLMDAIGWDAAQSASSPPPPPPIIIEAAGSTSLAEVGNNFFLYAVGTTTGPSLKLSGTAVVEGQFGGFAPIGAEQIAGGYEVAWKMSGADQYTVWNTDSSGNYISNLIGVVSGASSTLQSFETSFHQDLNGDGVIGLPPPPPPIIIEAAGSTSLAEVGNNFFLYAVGTTTGPSLKLSGTAVVEGQFGGFAPIGAEQIAGGYEVAWKMSGADQYTVWNTDSSGNYISNLIGVVSGASSTLQSFETSFHQDLNGDGVIGLPPPPPPIIIEAAGSTSLAEVGNNFFLYAVGTTTGPSLKLSGTAVVEGQFGGFAPIGAEQIAGGYEVAWKMSGADQYTVWNTDSSGNYISNLIGVVSGASSTLQSFETSFHQDLNGDGVIGLANNVKGNMASSFAGITDFTPNSNELDFSRLVFGDHLATGGANSGTLDPTHFVSNSDGHATGTGPQFIYNTMSHILSFDSDWTDGTVAVQMAKLENSAPLTFSDIHLV